MELIITILRPFFEDPYKEFQIRELARVLKINHTTVRNYLNKLAKEGFLVKKQVRHYPVYASNINSKKYLNLKLYYNLEKIRISRILEDIEKYYDFPIVVLFGSYSKAIDDQNSDIDLCIITDIKKEFPNKKYESIINRKISLHKFTRKELEELMKKNPELINSIVNGIVLSGQLEVLQ